MSSGLRDRSRHPFFTSWTCAPHRSSAYCSGSAVASCWQSIPSCSWLRRQSPGTSRGGVSTRSPVRTVEVQELFQTSPERRLLYISRAPNRFVTERRMAVMFAPVILPQCSNKRCRYFITSAPALGNSNPQVIVMAEQSPVIFRNWMSGWDARS